MPRMVQPLRSDERSLPKPVSFRVTQAEQDAIDRCVLMFGLAKEGADLGPHRGEACRRLAAAAVNGVIVADMTDADRAKLDRLVDQQEAQLARLGARGFQPTRSTVLLSLLAAAPEPTMEPTVKAFVAAAPELAAAVHEAAARKTVAVPIAAEHEAPAPSDVDELHAALVAAMNAGETPSTIAAALDVSASAIRGFKSSRKGLGASRREELARILREKGYLKDGA